LYYYYFLAHEKKKPLQPHKVYILSLSLSLSLSEASSSASNKEKNMGGRGGEGRGSECPPIPLLYLLPCLERKTFLEGSLALVCQRASKLTNFTY
jgi:hypothetical protein